MFKRHQVLLSDWQVEYAKYISERYDLSLSEAIRIALSVGYLYIVSSAQPEYKAGIDKKQLLDRMKEASDPANEAEMHKFISKIYFEARKATEYRLKAVKKTK